MKSEGCLKKIVKRQLRSGHWKKKMDTSRYNRIHNKIKVKS